MTPRALSLMLLLALALALAALPAAAQSRDVQEWLRDMNTAFTELSYDGVFSYFSGSDLASLRIVHMVVDGEQRERLVHLNGAPREIIRVGEEVSCILMPGDAILDLERDIPAGPFARAFVRRYDQISSHYRFDFFGEDRVAGRPAVRLAVSPLDKDRFGYRLWLDQETRLLLRSELVDDEGGRLEIFQFNTLKLGDEVQQSALEPQDHEGEVVSHLFELESKPAVAGAIDPRWRTGWMPEGFTMAAAQVRARQDLSSINTMMYSDGLAAFSVFIEDMPPAGAASMVSRNGATVAVTHLMPGPEDRRHLVTVVGELPTATAQRIAASVEFEPR